MGVLVSPNGFMGCGIFWLILMVGIKSEDLDSSFTACEIEKLLKPLFSAPDDRTIQAQALRQRLANLLRSGFAEQVDNGIEDKRSISSLARWNDLPMKRNLQALARAGYLKAQSEDYDDDDNDTGLKRSLQSLLRSGQLSALKSEGLKRSVAALARNGELHRTRQDIEDLLDELYYKRNIGSLARDFNFPSYGKRFLGSLAKSGDLTNRLDGGKRNIASVMRNGKRNLASLIRNNNLPDDAGYDELKRNVASLARDGGRFMGKRNVAALLRQDSYQNEKHYDENQTERPENDSEELENEKRNVASIKAGIKPRLKRSLAYADTVRRGRNKRQVDYYGSQNDAYPQSVYLNHFNNPDYDDLMQALNGGYPILEKRFLGSVARSGWPSYLVKSNIPDKRHIGSLARLGWLPTFRTARRFNRSGRSATSEECAAFREASTNGEAENDAYSEDAVQEGKQFLLIPAVDKLLLRKFPLRGRSH